MNGYLYEYNLVSIPIQTTRRLTLPTATVIYERQKSFISVLCARQLKILADETRLAVLELL